ncbi:TonB-dependent receptor [Flaviaesturariibacter flavus]|uniref:TonB-dependent receptor n=1 Tax=Flaviaesturariibacter flavus TaxID=2502780 RepID=A0A4R1BC81_9BACT|nr:TonB-dependent receptor [Flaviaesturariibacter flavus]TCJ14548.1 TonB-dependent receptor [Flaviaesturariibacter flavus]
MNPAPRTLLVFLLSLSASITFAQNKTIRGTVSDAGTKRPLEYATLSLFRNPDSLKVIDGTTSDSLGHFQLQVINPGDYLLLVEAIGYERRREPVSIRPEGPKELALSCSLKPRSGELQNVVIASRSSLIDNRIDKLVFNAEKDLTSQSGSATDVLKKVPQVGVDADGNVSLAGNSGIRFLIDGKPSSAFGSNVADVLAALPASQIKSIEVITNPGARYDAQGMGGIINIILRKSNVRGMNGTVNISGGTRMENGSLNLNFRSGSFGLNAFASGNTRPRVNTPYRLARSSRDGAGSQLLLQDGDGSLGRKGLQTGLGFDWTLPSRSALSGNVSFNKFASESTGQFHQEQSTYNRSGALVTNSGSDTRNRSSFSFQDVDASLQFTKKYAREDEELEIEASTSLGKRSAASSSAEYNGGGGAQKAGTAGNNPGNENESQVQANFTYPLKEHTLLSVGGKAGFTGIHSSSLVSVFRTASAEYLPDAGLSTELRFRQQVYAAYSELSFPVGNYFDVKAGARYERTERQAAFSATQKPGSLAGYNTLVPSLFLMRKTGEGQQVRLSYARRIERPDYRDLNPFINTSDPKNISAGNPMLVPEVGNRVELSYSRDFAKLGTMAATLFFRTNNHDIQPYVAVFDEYRVGDTVYHNVSVSTRENIGTERNIGMNLFLETKSLAGVSLRSNLFLFYRHIRNTIDAAYSPESFNYRVNLNASWQMAPSWTSELFGNFNSARNEVQGRYPSFTTYTFAVRKQLWNKKGSLALTATNPFARYTAQTTALAGTSFTSTSTRFIPIRSFGLNFTWKFGKLEFKKENTENAATEIAP